MSLKNFSFPSVTFKQEYDETSANTKSTLGVCVVGMQYRVHEYGTTLAFQIDKTTDYSFESGLTTVVTPTTGCELDKNSSFDRVLVKQGAWEYKSYTGTDINTSATSVGNRYIALNATIADGYDKTVGYGFPSGGVKVGDYVYVKGTTATDTDTYALATVLKLDKDSTYGISRMYVNDLGDISAITSVHLCMLSDGVIPKAKLSWTTSGSSDAIQVASGITEELGLYDSTGTEVVCKLRGTASGTDNGMYFEFRELVHYGEGKLNSVDTLADVIEQLGTPSAQNPMALCCYFALAAGQGTTVYWTAIAEDTSTAYTNALDYLANYDGIYSIVPTSESESVVKACLASCETFSNDEESTIRRALWYGITLPSTVDIEDCVIDDDGWSSTDNTITFTKPVYTTTVVKGKALSTDASNDKLYHIESTGALTLIGDVSTNPSAYTIKLYATPSVTPTAGWKCRIVRTSPDNGDFVNEIVRRRWTQSERAVAVFCDDCEYDGEVVPNYAVAAAAAGMRAYEPFQRPLSNLTYSFFDSLDTHGFTSTELKTIGANGVWIVACNSDGTPINKKQITTAMANNLNKDEESIIAIADTIALDMCQIGRNIVGNSNISKELLNYLKLVLATHLDAYLINETENVYIGAPLLEYEIVKVAQDTVNLDRIYASFTCTPPKPFNKFDMTMLIK